MPVPDSDESRDASIERAKQLAIAVVESDAFLDEVKRVVDLVSVDAPYAEAWRAVDAGRIVDSLRTYLPTVTWKVEDGPRQYLRWRWAGNLATEPKDSSGPVRINAYGLPRPDGSIANTIVHEAVHRIGLSHPSYARDAAAGICEPPYVIGALVERHIEGGAWQRSAGDCSALVGAPAKVAPLALLPSPGKVGLAGRSVPEESLLKYKAEQRAAAAAPFVTVDRLRDACASAHAPSVVRDFCSLDLSQDGTQKFLVPTAIQIDSALFGGAATPVPFVGRAEAGRSALTAVGFGSTLSLNQGALVVGLTDFVIGRAQDAGRVYLTQQFATGLCQRRVTASLAARKHREAFREEEETVAAYIPATCALLTSGEELLGNRYALPSFGVLQSTMERDLQGLPDVVVGRLSRYGIGVFSGMRTNPELAAGAERLAAVIGMARLSASVMAQRDLLLSFRMAGNDLLSIVGKACAADTSSVAGCPVPWDRMPYARDAVIAATLIGTFLPSDLDSLADPAHRGRMLSLSAKALLVNARGAGDAWGTPLGGAFYDFLDRHRLGEVSGDGTVEIAGVPFSGTLGRATIAMTAMRDTLRTALGEAGNDRVKVARAYAANLPRAAGALGAIARADSGSLERLARVSDLVDRVSLFPGYVVDQQYTLLVAELMALVPGIVDRDSLRTQLQNAAFHPKAVRTVQFTLDAARSQSAEAFHAVLESYAAPANAYLRKRTARDRAGYWTLNAYVGGAAGKERASGSQVQGDPDAVRYGGLTLPVGFETGWTVDKRLVGAVGVLVQLLDLGQVATWRARGTDSVSTTPPGLTLGSVFAPGAYVVVNAARVPLAFGVGYVHAPMFRDLTFITDPARPKADVHRLALFLAVDVPLLP